MNFNKFIYGLGLTLLGGLVLTGCRKDDPEEPGDTVATFQYEISAGNWAEVTFTNYSQTQARTLGTSAMATPAPKRAPCIRTQRVALMMSH